jgi:hypothetical protein
VLLLYLHYVRIIKMSECRQACTRINVWALMLAFWRITTQQQARGPLPWAGGGGRLYAKERSDSDLFTNRSSCVSSASGGRNKAMTSYARIPFFVMCFLFCFMETDFFRGSRCVQCSWYYHYSSVGIATGYRLDTKRDKFWASRCPDRFWGPPSLLSNGYRGLFPRSVKRPRREANHSPPTSAETKKTWINTSTSPYVFMAYCFVKHRDFTLPLLCVNLSVVCCFLLRVYRKVGPKTWRVRPPPSGSASGYEEISVFNIKFSWSTHFFLVPFSHFLHKLPSWLLIQIERISGVRIQRLSALFIAK